jgi:uncharacterized membrane protein HdeD (DUF308 family)
MAAVTTIATFYFIKNPAFPGNTARDAIWEGVYLAVGLAIGVRIYFWPSFVARRERKRNLRAIFVLNLLAGWLLIGWIVAMVWAYTTEDKKG